MSVLRKIPVWIVLTSYLFANTVASSLHDHRDCSGHSEGAHHHAADCAAVDHRHNVSGHRCHHQHANHQQGQHAGQSHEPGTNRPSQPPRRPNGHQPVGDGQHDPQHCVVCDFLALAPLSAPHVTLVSAGEDLPEFVVQHVLPVSRTTVETHLARGPPAV